MGFTGDGKYIPPGERNKVENATNTANAVLDTINRTLCTINPNRPGCIQFREESIVSINRNNTIMLVILTVLIAVTFVIVIAKKK